MSVLTKYQILENIKTGNLVFEPGLDAFQLQPHSVDLRLGFTFYIAKTWEITQKGRTALSVDYLNNISNKNFFDIVVINPGQYFEILPKEYIIATTLENIHIKNLALMGILFPRSSFNRRGLSVDISGVIDAGYYGHLMIPIKNNTNNQTIRLYPGERICQVTFEELTSELRPEDAAIIRGSKNRKHEGTTFAKPEKDEENKYIIEGTIENLKRDYNI